MSINGNLYDWESVEIVAPNGIMIGVTEISYADELGIEARYGKGAIPRGYGRKNYKASGSLTLDKDEYVMLQAAMGGSIYQSAPVPIIVKYGNDDQLTIVDVLPDCKFTKADTSAKQDSENAGEMKLDFTILSPIKWGGTAAYE